MDVLVRAVSSRVALGSIINLNRPAHYVHWHFFLMSVPNVVVLVLMVVVFTAAIALPFPGSRARRRRS